MDQNDTENGDVGTATARGKLFRLGPPWTAGPAGSVPLGNGMAGINVWIDCDGSIGMYLALTGAYSENARLLKIGRLRFRFAAALDADRAEVVLDPGAGELRIVEAPVPDGSAGAVGESVPLSVRIWIDVDSPTVNVEYESIEPRELSVALELWRTAPREIPQAAGALVEIHSAYGLAGAPDPVIVRPDTVVDAGEGAIAWCHHNRGSVWRRNMELQGLGDLCDNLEDPLDGLAFGAVVTGDGMVRDAGGPGGTSEAQATVLRTVDPSTSGDVTVSLHMSKATTAEDWLSRAERLLASADPIDRGEQTGTGTLRRRTSARRRTFWEDFDGRSYIELLAGSGNAAADTINTAYRLQRHMLAWAAGGSYPLKFNGSLFTVDWGREEEDFDPDYRRWGGHFWFQNTRLSYWPMLVSGDWALMDSFFDFYKGLIPLSLERTRRYFDHAGVFFPETLTPWGTYAENNYGWDREGRHPSYVENRYIRHYHQGSIELLAMALDRYSFDPDPKFLAETLAPLAEAIVPFFDEHYERVDGRIRFYPSQSLETWQDAADPMPEIAGLRWVLPRLAELPDGTLSAVLSERVHRMTGELPPIPLVDSDDGLRLAAAAEIFEKERNMEHPELYAVFPYRLFAQGSGDIGDTSAGTIARSEVLNIARRSYSVRRHPRIGGWCQDGIQAAYLGLADEAATVVTDRVQQVYGKARFPAFWGPNFDWIPDQDHGSVVNMTLQSMLLQYDGDAIFLLPAWPRSWDVRFRLHAPKRTVVEGEYRNGRVIALSVEPESRRRDVVVPTDLQP